MTELEELQEKRNVFRDYILSRIVDDQGVFQDSVERKTLEDVWEMVTDFVNSKDEGNVTSDEKAQIDEKSKKALRDKFAMAALTGICGLQNVKELGIYQSPNSYAEEAYTMADAMMEARKK